MKAIGIMMGVFVVYILFQRPEIISAAERTVSGTEEIWLDNSHSITVDYAIKVTYDYDEGYTGWVENMEMLPEAGVGSNTVNIEDVRLIDEIKEGSSGCLVYYMWCHERWNSYHINIYFQVYCDEWGDLSCHMWVERLD